MCWATRGWSWGRGLGAKDRSCLTGICVILARVIVALDCIFLLWSSTLIYDRHLHVNFHFKSYSTQNPNHWYFVIELLVSLPFSEVSIGSCLMRSSGVVGGWGVLSVEVAVSVEDWLFSRDGSLRGKHKSGIMAYKAYNRHSTLTTSSLQGVAQIGLYHRLVTQMCSE